MDRTSGISSRSATMVGVIAVLASLYFAKSLLLTLSIAVLVSLLLAPFASRMQRWGLPRMAAVGIVVTLAFLAVALLGWSATRQVSDLAMKLPQYRANIASKSLVLGPAGEYLLKGYATLEEISEEVLSSARSRKERLSTSESPRDKAAMTAQSPFQIMGGAFLSFLESLGNTVVTIILVVFLLLYHSDIRDRLIHLFGDAQVHITTHTMSDAALSVSRYLLMQSVVNASYGSLVTLGLFALGIPNALLLGLAAALLRFIPYVGPWLGALMPLLLALAVFDTWAPAVIFLSSLIILELLTANVAEPWLYGTKTGISPLAVILAAIFWSWLWGGMGLLLAIPLTVSLVSLAKSIPQLAFLNTLLGSETSILPRMQLYHRLLGRNEEEAAELVEAHLKGSTLLETCDTLLVPALGLFEADRHQGNLDETKVEVVLGSVKRIVEDLAELPVRLPPADAVPITTASSPAMTPGARIPILCLPSDDASDELAAFMLTKILTAAGYDARCLSAEASAGEKIEEIRKQEAEVLCISALPPRALIPTRYLYKRIRREYPDADVVVGLWTASGDPAPLKERMAEDGKIHLVTTFAEAQKCLQELVTALSLRKAASKDSQERSMAEQSRSEARP